MSGRLFTAAEAAALVEYMSNERAIGAGLYASGLYFKGIAAEYPREAANKPPMPMTPRQRRGFFYRLRRGLIEVPYRRGMSPTSQTVGKRWAIDIRDGGMTVAIGNNATYARHLFGQKTQSAYMARLGWRKLSRVYVLRRERIREQFLIGLQQHIRETV